MPVARDEAGPDGVGRRSLRAEVIRLYERLLPDGLLDDQAGIFSRAHMYSQLAKLRAGQTVQLHRFGELTSLPTDFRPSRAETWTLAELRGDELVPVPTWGPGKPRPAEWAV